MQIMISEFFLANNLTLFFTGYFYVLFYTRRDGSYFCPVNWGDDDIPPIHDVTFLVKNDFFLLLRCLLQIIKIYCTF